MIRRSVLLILPLLFASCMQTENSSTLDADTYGSSGSSAVKAIFLAKCTSCHYHSFHAMSADQLVASGDLIKGDALNSPLYYRIIGSSGAKGPKDMPQSGSISATDLATIEAWINSL